MLYLYKLPECKEFAYKIKLKAFQLFLRWKYIEWIKPYRGIRLDRRIDTPDNFKMSKLVRFVWDEMMVREFDLLWEIASVSLKDFHVFGLMEASFKKQRLKKKT